MKHAITLLLLTGFSIGQSIINSPYYLGRNNIRDYSTAYQFEKNTLFQFSHQKLYEMSELKINAIAIRSKSLEASISWNYFNFSIYTEHVAEFEKLIKHYGETTLSMSVRSVSLENIFSDVDYYLSLNHSYPFSGDFVFNLFLDKLSFKSMALNGYFFSFRIFYTEFIYRKEFDLHDFILINTINLNNFNTDLSYSIKKENVGLAIKFIYEEYHFSPQITYQKELGLSYSITLAFSSNIL